MSNKWGTQMQIFIKHILKEHYDNMSFCVDTNILTIQSREETLELWNKLIKEHNILQKSSWETLIRNFNYYGIKQIINHNLLYFKFPSDFDVNNQMERIKTKSDKETKMITQEKPEIITEEKPEITTEEKAEIIIEEKQEDEQQMIDDDKTVIEEETIKAEPTTKCNCHSKKLNKLSIKLNKKTMDLASFYLKHPVFRNYKNRTSHKIKGSIDIKNHKNKLENMIGDLESIIKNLSERL